jgi:hypothetical protein
MNLTLIPTEELLNELFSRYDAAVWCSIKRGIQSNKDFAFERKYEGDYATCSGLCDIVKEMILGDMNGNSREPEER